MQTLGDFVKQVGGEHVEVDFAVESGQSLAGYDASESLRQRMGNSRLIVAGGTTEPWAIADASSAFAPHRVLRLDVLIPTTQSADNAADRTGLAWLDPILMQSACDELVTRLRTMQPEHATYFQERGAATKGRIGAIVKSYQPRFQQAHRPRVMALSREFDPLAARFGVDVVHPLNTTADRISDWEMRELQTASQQEHIVTLIIRADTPAALREDFARRTGWRLVMMEPYGSSAAPGRETYERLLKYNLDQLLEAVNGQ